MEHPGDGFYTDGYCSLVEEEDVFLCPPSYNLFSRFCYPPKEPRKETITESQYRGIQGLAPL